MIDGRERYLFWWKIVSRKKGIFVRNTQEYYSENSVDLCIENI